MFYMEAVEVSFLPSLNSCYGCFCVNGYISWELAILVYLLLGFGLWLTLLKHLKKIIFSYLLMLIRGYYSFNGKMDLMSLIRVIISGQRLTGLSIDGMDQSQTIMMLALAAAK